MDERYDMSRAVMGRRWLYIRHFRPDLPYVPYLEYMFRARGYQSWARAVQQADLPASATRFWGEKPSEELYDLAQDPDNVSNLAQDPAAVQTLERMRAALREWILQVNDNGFMPEGAAAEGYEASRQPGVFPLSEAFAVATLAADRSAAHLPRLIAALSHASEHVRWWAAQGCAILAEKARTAEGPLRARLGDASGAVRVAAAEALARLGQPEAALPVLEACLADLQAPFVALQAANVLDRMGVTARPALPTMQRVLSLTDKIVPENGPHYVHRALQRTVAVLEGKAQPLPSGVSLK
jgi:hypothetical protein